MSAAAVKLRLCVITDKAVIFLIQFKYFFLGDLNAFVVVVTESHSNRNAVTLENRHILADRFLCKCLVNTAEHICAC